ncbi:MAG: hypothetical protein GWN77_06540 [Gammaproteobacteria bacterium]|nr:hypothetical protein [Gammaproteobacteria bacterium]
MRRLLAAIENLRELRDLESELGIGTAVQMDIILKNIQKTQPIGEPEHGFELFGRLFGGTTVSERRGHVPISEGWKPSVEFNEDGYSIRLKNVSQHAGAIVEGHKRSGKYVIPRAFGNKLVFWWGAPQRWPARDGAPAGPRVFDFVKHPGPKPDPFVKEATQTSKKAMSESVSSNIKAYVRRMLLDSNVLREV